MPLISNTELMTQWRKHKRATASGLSTQYRLAKEAHQFNAGDDMAYQASIMDKGRKKMVIFNKIKPFIDSISGFMIQLRREPEYNATIQDDAQEQQYSNLLTGISTWARRKANLPQLETQQDKEMLICGYGAIDTNILYESDPDGRIEGELMEYNDVGWDPQARRTNLLDSRWVYRRRKYSMQEALKRFKGSQPTDFAGAYDGENKAYEYNPNDGIYTKIASGLPDESQLVEIYYYQYWTLETYWRAPNPLHKLGNPYIANQLLEMLQEVIKARGEEEESYEYIDDIFDFDPMAETLVMTGPIKSDVKAFFARFDIELEVQEYLKKCYYTAVMSDLKVFEHFKSPDQQGFTIKFKTGDYDKLLNSWYGLVRQLIEPAKYANKALTEMLYVIASNSKGGVMYERSAVEDPALFEQQYATTNAAIQVADGALERGAIQPKATAALPNGYESIYQMANSSLTEVSGINKEFLGSSENKQVSALFEEQRIKQVITTLANFFDSIGLYQIEHARLMITYIRMLAQNAPGRLVRILQPDGTPNLISLTEDKFAPEYDVDITEAPTSASQKEKTVETLIEFADKLGPAASNIYPIIIDYLPLKNTEKTKLKQALQPNQQSMAEQSAMKQLAFQGQEAKIKKDMADANLRMVDAAYKQASIPREHAETVRTAMQAEQTYIENHLLSTHGRKEIEINA